MKQEAKNQMKTEIMKETTLGGVLKVLTKYYDTDNCEVGFVLKNMLFVKLDSLVNATRCKAKKQYQ